MTKRILPLLSGIVAVLGVAVVARLNFRKPVPSASSKPMSLVATPVDAKKIVEADVAPGSSGLSFVKSFSSVVSGIRSSDEFARLVRRVAIGRVVPSKTNYFDSELTVFDPSTLSVAKSYLFVAQQSDDPGYIGSPHFSGKEGITFEFGRYPEFGEFRFHNFDLRALTLSAFKSNIVQNYDVTYSPDGRFLTYTSGGFAQVSDSPIVPFSLYICQRDATKPTKIYSGDYNYDSASWLPDNTLAYSRLEPKARAKIPITYIYDPSKNATRLWMNNCASPRMSPDGRTVVYFGARDLSRDYTDTTHRAFSDADEKVSNRVLFVKSIKSGKVSRLRGKSEFRFEPIIRWSSDSTSFVVASRDSAAKLELYRVGRNLAPRTLSIGKADNSEISDVHSFDGKFLVEVKKISKLISPLTGDTISDYKILLVQNTQAPREIFSAHDITGLDLSD